jgi:hypothetical protein
MTSELSDPIRQLNLLFGNLQGAHVNCEIWWTYKNNQDKPKYLDVLEHYPYFFKSSIHAHFLATLIGLSKLFDKGKDTISIRNLLKVIHKSELIDNSQLRKFEKDLNSLEPLVKKIKTLRNKAFAHMTKQKSYSDVLKEAQINHDHIRVLLDKTMALLNGIGERGTDFISGGREDTLRMLEDLKNIVNKGQ